MTLHRKSDGSFIVLSVEEETSVRADPDVLISNDSGLDVVLPSEDAAALKLEWAANAPQPL